MEFKIKDTKTEFVSERLFFYSSEKKFNKDKIKDVIEHVLTIVDNERTIEIQKDLNKEVKFHPDAIILESSRFNILEQYLVVKGFVSALKIDQQDKYVVLNKGMFKRVKISENSIEVEFYGGKQQYFISNRRELLKDKDETNSVYVSEKVFKYLKEVALKKDVVEI